MTRAWRLIGWGGGVAVVVLATVIVGALGANEVARRFTAFDLTQVPVCGVSRAVPEMMPPGWRTYGTRRCSVTVPPMFTRRQSVSSAPTALVMTTPRHTAWVSITATPLPAAWWPRWYRWCVYADRNPVALMGKALLVPPMGVRRPRMEECSLGPWQAHLYLAPRRMVADLFDRSHQVTVVMAWRVEDAMDWEVVRTMLATIRVGRRGS